MAFYASFIGLENRRGGNLTEGSNPSSSAIFTLNLTRKVPFSTALALLFNKKTDLSAVSGNEL